MNRIVIGLGGGGAQILNKIIDISSENLSENTSFVLIDTVESSNIDKIHQIVLDQPSSIVCNCELHPWLPTTWWPKAGAGTGLQRITGKAFYTIYRTHILNRICKIIKNLRTKTGDIDFIILLVNTLGDGTGSSMFIDLAIDIRNAIERDYGKQPLIIGVGILPSEDESLQMGGNAYGALKELHFLLQQQEYRGGNDYTNPFEMYFVVERGFIDYNKFATVIADLTTYLLFFQKDEGGLPVMGKSSWIDINDLMASIRGINKFSTFGYYRVLFPFERLSELYEVENSIKNEEKRKNELLDRIESDPKAKISDFKGNLEEYEKNIIELHTKKNKIKEVLRYPVYHQREKCISLSDEEIEILRNYNLKEGNFKEAMEFLGREEEYLSHTHDPIRMKSILYNPLLDYDMAGAKQAIDFFVGLIASNSKNIEYEKLRVRDLMTLDSSSQLAKNAEIRMLSTPNKYVFTVYSLLFGIEPSYPTSTKKLRIRSIDKFLKDSYEAAGDYKIQHHAFLFGDYKMFEELVGIPVDSDLFKANNDILKFWGDYDITIKTKEKIKLNELTEKLPDETESQKEEELLHTINADLEREESVDIESQKEERFGKIEQLRYEIDKRDQMIALLMQQTKDLKAKVEIESGIKRIHCPVTPHECPNPKVKLENKYFVAHAFSEDKIDDLRKAISETLKDTELKPYYADEEVRKGHILCKICERIRATKFGIYELSDQNPNVTLELGIAYGFGKPALLIARKGSKIISDLQGLDRIEYGSYAQLTRELKKKMQKFIS